MIIVSCHWCYFINSLSFPKYDVKQQANNSKYYSKYCKSVKDDNELQFEGICDVNGCTIRRNSTCVKYDKQY